MELVWAAEAVQDRLDIWDAVAADKLDAAVRLDERIAEAAEQLTRQPALGRKGRIAGTREWVVHENYLLVYEATEEAVVILAVVHARRRWPPAR